MPHRPNIPCQHPGCPSLIPYGTRYCDKHKLLHSEEKRPAASRGYASRWQKARKRYLEAHPLCVECLKESRYVLTPEINVNHAQLILTSHDVWQFSNELLRRDELWVTDKD